MQYTAPREKDRQAFHQGTNHQAYQILGAHPVSQDGEAMWHFAVWAPNARAVMVVGEFCGWDTTRHPMAKQHDGTWELRLAQSLFAQARDMPATQTLAYKYAVFSQDGTMALKADPYAFQSELRPNNASILCDLSGYAWGDGEWMDRRTGWDPYRSPVNIYEMHLGSWRRDDAGELLSYAQIADRLIPYMLDMGYTHVELLPVMEHPLDISWGYQVTGYYAPTARHGSAQEFMAFVDKMHQAGIGVLLDWVPAHFPRDEIGLRRFDGTACYEHVNPNRAEMAQWGTLMFDFARGEVNSFLLSNACFWLEYYHVDGLRCDAVSAMLYHDFGRENAWVPNRFGGKENLEAIAFLRRLNETVYRHFPGVMMIAEEATAFPMVTKPTYLGGLGFGFKWNMGWMNDMLRYIKLDHYLRRTHHDKLTFSLHYAFSENYILPFSHDEVVHGKHSMLDKQPGDLWRKFAGLRALYGYTMAHPGKKLLFMGGEFGQFIEWKDSDQLDWFLLRYERHPQMQQFVRELNRFYRDNSPLWEVEDSWSGFTWLQANDTDNSVIVFLRTNLAGESLLCATNFTPAFFGQYRFGLPDDGLIAEEFNSDLGRWGGSNQYNAHPLHVEAIPMGEFPFSAEICLPPLSTVFFSYQRRQYQQAIRDPRDIQEVQDIETGKEE